MISPMCPRCEARRIVLLSATLLLARRLGFTRMRAPASARRRHVVTPSAITRRTLMKGGGAALAGMSVLRIVGPTLAFQTPVTGEVVPWLDQLEKNPVPEVIVQQLDWEQLDSW